MDTFGLMAAVSAEIIGLSYARQEMVMNEATKTLIYVAIAAAVAATAIATRPVSPSLDPNDDVGETFYEEFTDAATATSLEILKFDNIIL